MEKVWKKQLQRLQLSINKGFASRSPMPVDGLNTATSAGAEATVAMSGNACMAITVYLFINTAKISIIHSRKYKHFYNT
jgi:hypothetical protein